MDADRVEVLAHEAPAPERGLQGDAAHDGGRTIGRVVSAADEVLARVAGAGLHPGQRQAEDEREDRRPGRGDERQLDRLARPAGSQVRPDRAPRGPPHEAGERDGEEGDGDHCRARSPRPAGVASTPLLDGRGGGVLGRLVRSCPSGRRPPPRLVNC